MTVLMTLFLITNHTFLLIQKRIENDKSVECLALVTDDESNIKQCSVTPLTLIHDTWHQHHHHYTLQLCLHLLYFHSSSTLQHNNSSIRLYLILLISRMARCLQKFEFKKINWNEIMQYARSNEDN